MALNRTDCLLLLTELEEKGVDVRENISKLMSSNVLPLDVVKFINDRRELDVVAFYTMLRKNYNKKRSNLYKNIVTEIVDPQQVLTTLSALQLQIILYSKGVENKKLFFDNVRAKEIVAVLDNYFRTFDITNALKLLRLFKADMKTFETLNK